jgi:endonuclease/exonuclease/phosphatase family metal-dependent hydrolase
VNLPARHPGDGRSRTSPAWLVAAVGCALILALTVWSRLPGTVGPPGQESSRYAAGRPSASGAAPSSFVLMQLNLCLSGLAGCYDEAGHPALLREVVARVRAADPDAVTLNEACRRDAARIARRTGYHLRFSTVIYGGAPLRCTRPEGRGVFGDAVLTAAPVATTRNRAFVAQVGLEQRRWLCVTTRTGQDVCTAHLSTGRSSTGATVNDVQCAELAAVLARRVAARTVAFGGDVNRVGSCAPDGAWSRSDASADQSPGLQHVYGSASALRAPGAEVLPTTHSDHDVLLVSARLVPRQ